MFLLTLIDQVIPGKASVETDILCYYQVNYEETFSGKLIYKKKHNAGETCPRLKAYKFKFSLV